MSHIETNQGIPARIVLQIREGMLNELASFELLTIGNPIQDDDGILNHEANLWSIYTGLAQAQKTLLAEARESKGDLEPETEKWLVRMNDWVLA